MSTQKLEKFLSRANQSMKYRTTRYTKGIFNSIYKLLYRLPTIDSNDVGISMRNSLSLILEDICLPPHVADPNHDDVYPLMNIVQTINPQVVVELGTAHGNTVANICKICPQTHVYTVNAPVEEQSGELVTYQLNSDDIGRVYKKYGYTSQVTQILKNTLELDLSQYLVNNSVNLAIIDACHDTNYVLNDFFKVLPYINSTGVVLFHDTHPSMDGHLAGSYLACMKLKQKGFNIYHIRNTWWGIWSKGKLFPADKQNIQ